MAAQYPAPKAARGSLLDDGVDTLRLRLQPLIHVKIEGQVVALGQIEKPPTFAGRSALR